MAAYSFFQPFHGLQICRSHLHRRRVKSIFGQSKLLSPGTKLSSFSMLQDSRSINLSNKTCWPTRCIPCKSNTFKCRSFLAPDRASQVPIVKTASMVLTRSYKTLQGSPLALQLVPAVGIIFFSAWALVPFLRQSRNFLLRKSDNSWGKSATRYVAISYLRPLLLWIGVIIICRAFDPIVLPSEASQAVKLRLMTFVRSLSTVLTFAYCLSSGIQQAQRFSMEASDSIDTRNMGFQFAGKAIYTAVWVAAVSLFMELLGFSTQKWLTAGGLGTVLLTLAGREIFTNFLSSVMIHATRPFVVNEWIQTKIEGYEVSGTVEHVGWWSPTIVRGEDREAVHIPNHKFTVNVVRNLSQKSHWRIKTHLAISHLDVNKINNIVADMRKVLAKNPQVEQQRLHRRVFLENVNPENQALMILISCFVKTSHHEEYLCVKEAILLDLLRVISHHRARLATPIRTVQKIYSDADLDNIPFTDRGGMVSNRPLLLIEPPYKINGDDRPKTHSRTMRSSGDQDKATSRPIPNIKSDAKISSTSSDSKYKETPSAHRKTDTKADSASIGPETSNKTTAKLSLTSDIDSRKSAGASNTDPKVSDPSPDILAKKSADDKPPTKVGSWKERQTSKDGQSTSPSETTERSGSFTPSSQTKQEDGRLQALPSPSRPVLEENIVLGVALEGSKRTLPIEEDIGMPSAPDDVKELASLRNGNGAPASGKDKKDDPVSAPPHSPSDD